ncbi:toll/interleukin-1 receptor domain-containing protein [candidate division KSB1 bacterium]|nr:toll/interleukin-1 receptor domain-containing protein [candidate division KSB1 bacterium]
MRYDVFICHASEDKPEVVNPLVMELKRFGLKVWFDDFELTIGDSLRRSIDKGLSESKFGLVILSTAFFRKEWPKKELDGLIAKESVGEKVILPIWHNITIEEVRHHSPTLADRVAVSTSRGIKYVAQQICKAVLRGTLDQLNSQEYSFMPKRIAPAAIVALKEALTNIYWYKADLRSFLTTTLGNPAILTRLNWNDYKRNIVTTVVDTLATHQDEYLTDLLRLMSEVALIDDFSHLVRLEDGQEKARQAKASVEALRKLVAIHEELHTEQKKIEERRRATYEALLRTTAVKEKLERLTQEYYLLLSSEDPQGRGYKLERIINELFSLFDLDPKASFKIVGEQIDGAFTFDSTDYLFEAKWQQQPVGADELDHFAGKLSRKLDNTLGLFLSINSFSEDAVKTHSSGRRLMILMDGSDLMAVLEGRIDLIQLLLRKRRHAAQTGNIYLRIHEILL